MHVIDGLAHQTGVTLDMWETVFKGEKGKEEMKQGKREGGEERSVLDSCTLVEGLLFPVEYYVRTTRRMTSSQSQPDLRAVILSQLSRGRKRARPTTHTTHTTHTHSVPHSDTHTHKRRQEETERRRQEAGGRRDRKSVV